jgi:hypothetical protein
MTRDLNYKLLYMKISLYHIPVGLVPVPSAMTTGTLGYLNLHNQANLDKCGLVKKKVPVQV